jgi:hypothetical protein
MIISFEMGKRSDRLSVALPRDISDKARQLSALASKHGWAVFGVDREDPPTMTAIFEEAINVLAARAKKAIK